MFTMVVPIEKGRIKKQPISAAVGLSLKTVDFSGNFTNVEIPDPVIHSGDTAFQNLPLFSSKEKDLERVLF